MRFIIYCDESADKGKYYSNFYGGALISAADRETIEAALNNAKGRLKGEIKWTKVGQYNEADYIEFVDVLFDLIKANKVKIRIMFTQNINQTEHVEYVMSITSFFYYQFIKHAVGLRYCNDGLQHEVDVAVYLDDAPDMKKN